MGFYIFFRDIIFQYIFFLLKDRPADMGRSSVGFGSGRCQIAVRITDIRFFGVGFTDGSENEFGIWISFPNVHTSGQAPIVQMAANSRLWPPMAAYTRLSEPPMAAYSYL